MAAAMADQVTAVDQDTSACLPGIPLEQNIAFLNRAVLGRKGEVMLRHIVSFIPHKCFEVGEDEDEDEDEEESHSDIYSISGSGSEDGESEGRRWRRRGVRNR